MEISRVNFIHLLDLTKCNYRPSGRNQTCSPAIPVQCSNQLSNRGQLLSCNGKFMYIDVYKCGANGRCMYKYQDFGRLHSI